MGIPQRLGRRPRPILALGLALAFVLGACGGSTSAPLENVGAPVTGTGSGGGQAAPTAAPAAAPAQPGEINGNPSSALQDSLRIVYTGSLQLVVDDLQQALAKGRAAVAAVGGYIGASEEHNDGDTSVATITYRIPAARWEDTLAALRGVGSKVVAEQTQATEVGSQIVDLEARIRNLRASESALVEIAKGTGKVSDLLEVEAQLTDVRGQIEQLDAQRTQLNDQVAYGTLVTTYGTEIKAVQETAQGWDPAKDVDSAAATLIGAGQAIASAAIWVAIVGLPLVLLLLVLALIVRFAYRRFGPKPGPSATKPDPVPGWGASGGGDAEA
jgi:Domain of unknown function (DUF4349)